MAIKTLLSGRDDRQVPSEHALPAKSMLCKALGKRTFVLW